MGIPPITRGLARRLEESTSTTESKGTRETNTDAPGSVPAKPWSPMEAKPLRDVHEASPGPIQVAAAGEGLPGIALAAPGLFLSASGHIVSRPGQAAPVTNQELGATLTEAAEAMAQGIFPFAVQGIPFAQQAAAFEALSKAIDLGLDAANFGGNADQALQTRAAVAPLLLDLAESLDVAQPEQKTLFAHLFARYEDATKNEPHPDLRGFMSADLARIKHFLPSEVLPAIERLTGEVVATVPYDDRDHDGVMDNWDRHFPVNTFKAGPASGADLGPRKPPVLFGHVNGAAFGAGVSRGGEPRGQGGIAPNGIDRIVDGDRHVLR